jgi:hypothetical protein
MDRDAGRAAQTPQAADELERLRERLRFYESFDQLIQSNVATAGELLRESVALRESAAAEAESTGRQLRESRARELDHFRALFSVMLDEVTLLQGYAERLARRLEDALDSLEAQLPPGAGFPPLPTAIPDDLEARLDDENPVGETEPEALPQAVAKEGLDEPRAAETTIDDGAMAPSPGPETGRQNLEPAAGVVPAAGAADSLSETPVVSELAAVATLAAPETREPGPFMVLVHGVPRAATALSLKQHLEQLTGVERVEPREFAAGVLRLQLIATRDLVEEDLSGWSQGLALETIHTRPGLLEVRLRDS